MSENQSFVTQIIKRRVPQIVGLYIAATWMIIEIGEWVIGKFNLLPDITSYIFIGMTIFLPSIIFLAYQYGQKGKDPLKKTTFIFIPLNLLIAVLVMIYSVEPIKATEIKSVIDEKGEKVTYEVPKAAFHKYLIGFHWENNSKDAELDWMKFGIPWLLNRDLKRSLFIDTQDSISSNSIKEALTKSEIPIGEKIPSALMLKLARSRYSNYYMTGRFNFDGKDYAVNLDVFETQSGQKVLSQSLTGKDVFDLIDALSIEVKRIIGVSAVEKNYLSDMPVAEHTSSSLEAIEIFIHGLLSRHLESDLVKAQKQFEKAIEVSPSFVSSIVQLAYTQFMTGKAQDALASIDQAFKYDYQFSLQEKFLYRSLVHMINGDYVSVVKVYDIWIELYPDDVIAHETRVQILMITGLDANKALSSLLRLRELLPQDNSVLTRLSNLYILMDNLPEAIKVQKHYLEKAPDDMTGWMSLADLYERNNQFSLANETLSRIILLDGESFLATSKLIKLMIKLGDVEKAKELLEQSWSKLKSDDERFLYLTTQLTWYVQQGRLLNALDLYDDINRYTQHLPLMLRLFSNQFIKAVHLVSIGEEQKALNEIETAKNQLQAPFNSIMELGKIGIFYQNKNQEKLIASINELKQFLSENPNPMIEPMVVVGEAYINELNHEFAKAVPKYKKAINMMKGSVVNSMSQDSILTTEIGLAKLMHKAGQSEEALALLRKIIAAYPAMPVAFKELAVIYADLDDKEKYLEAVAHVEKFWEQADEEYLEYKAFLELRDKAFKDE